MYRSFRVVASRPAPSAASSAFRSRASASTNVLNLHRHVVVNSQRHHATQTAASKAWFSTVPIDQPYNDKQHSHQSSKASNQNEQQQNHHGHNDLRNPKPDFNDSKSAFQSQTTKELIRAGACFQLCQFPFLVNNAETMLNISRKILGSTITDASLRATLFGHFCAGEDDKQIQPVLDKLEKNGIGSILDYAAENEGELEAPAIIPTESGELQRVREYDYESEAQCDQHVQTFKKCIQHVADSGVKDGYAAIKVTALGNPKLLVKMSQTIIEAKRLFAKFDIDGDGYVSPDEFKEAYNTYFNADEKQMKELIKLLDPDDVGKVDYIAWSSTLSPHDLPAITSNCSQIGPLSLATPTQEEIELMEAMFARAYDIADTALKVGTRLLIDAEQTKFQPAIDSLVLELQRKYNAKGVSDKPIIYNTYQCYLKDSTERLITDFERSERFDYHFGAKLVRGAYMESEKHEADLMGFESPIHDTLQDTHDCYNNNVRFLLEKSTTSSNAVELMCATHNQESIEKAIDVLNEHDIDRKTPVVCFAQLYGMSDNLSNNLGSHGYRAYKYVPYGKVHEVMPYLLRRARENSSIAGGAKQELRMIKDELKRRTRQSLPLASN